MKVLHIITSLNPTHGGPTEAVKMLIHNRPPGCDNDVLTLDPPDAPFITLFPFHIFALGKAPKRWYSFKMLRWLMKNRNQYDAIILHGLWGFSSVAVLIAVTGRTPYAVFSHGMLDPYFKRRYPVKHVKKWIFWVLVQYWVLRFAKRVLFTASIERDLAEHSFWLWKWKPLVVSYGADPPAIDEERARAAFLDRCPEVRGKPFILYLGRIHRKKGCDLLLRAFADLAEQNSDVHLVMAGPDRERWHDELMDCLRPESVAAQVHWPGMLTGDSKWGAFAACEAFILPSHQENFGIAIAEALAFGRPVLITDKINIAADIAADGCGLVEEDTPAGIHRLLQRWFAMPAAEREDMANKARACYGERYDMKKNAQVLFDLIAKF